jgi:tyrosine-protein phosphatase SIW14
MKFRLLAVALTLATVAGCGTAPMGTSQQATSAAMQAASFKKAHKAPVLSASASGVNTENFAQVTNYLYRGGVPQDADMTALKNLGVTTDINLLGGGGNPGDKAEVVHEAAVAKSLGMNFINLPVPFNVAFPKSLADTFLKTVLDEAAVPNHAVYVHCTHGRDRTGTMVAFYRIEHDKYTPTAAIAEMQTFGFDPTKYPTFVTFLRGLGN